MTSPRLAAAVLLACAAAGCDLPDASFVEIDPAAAASVSSTTARR